MSIRAVFTSLVVGLVATFAGPASANCGNPSLLHSAEENFGEARFYERRVNKKMESLDQQRHGSAEWCETADLVYISMQRTFWYYLESRDDFEILQQRCTRAARNAASEGESDTAAYYRQVRSVVESNYYAAKRNATDADKAATEFHDWVGSSCALKECYDTRCN